MHRSETPCLSLIPSNIKPVTQPACHNRIQPSFSCDFCSYLVTLCHLPAVTQVGPWWMCAHEGQPSRGQPVCGWAPISRHPAAYGINQSPGPGDTSINIGDVIIHSDAAMALLLLTVWRLWNDGGSGYVASDL